MDHEHLPALSALLTAAPLAVLAQAALQLAAARGWAPARLVLGRAAGVSAPDKLAALLLMVAGVVHLALVPGHGDEPLLAISFLAAGLAMTVLAAAAVLRVPRWRPFAAAIIAAVLAGYCATHVPGLEAVDALGIGTTALEAVALGALLPRRRPLDTAGIT